MRNFARMLLCNGCAAANLSVLGSPCLQGELDFVAALRQQKTERIFVRIALVNGEHSRLD